jgi:hypothetical protein
MRRALKRSLGMTVLTAGALALGLTLAHRAAASAAASATSTMTPTNPPSTTAPATPAKTQKALFNMYCYWSGEATLGRVPGVVKTRIGELSGEVVEVEFDPAKTDIGKMANALKSQGGFYAVVVDSPLGKSEAKRYVSDSEIKETPRSPRFIESKYNLRTSHPDLAALDLTEQQAMTLNSWSYFGGPMPDVLTAEQKAKLKKIRERLASN